MVPLREVQAAIARTGLKWEAGTTPWSDGSQGNLLGAINRRFLLLLLGCRSLNELTSNGQALLPARAAASEGV